MTGAAPAHGDNVTPTVVDHKTVGSSSSPPKPPPPPPPRPEPGRHLSVFDGLVDRRRPRSFRSLDSREHSPDEHGMSTGLSAGTGNGTGMGTVTRTRTGPRTATATASSASAGLLDDDYGQLPNRWWLAASAFPMIAGTLGPVASAFSICALVRPWREAIPAGATMADAVFLPDPHWLTATNAVQLAMALVANAVLLLNMTRRLRFSIAQPITIFGWFFSSLALVALLATGAGPLRHVGGVGDGVGHDVGPDGVGPDVHVIWSQAFYYAIYAAVLYLLVACLMTATFAGACSGHYTKDFQLTNSQRTLMLQTILFLTYLLVGALVFCTIEGWPFLDAVYWADVTLFTVGFGDMHPETALGRALLFPYALVGVVSLGLVIGSIRSLMLERGKRRMDARMMEKNRRRVLQQLARQGHDGVLQPMGMGGVDGISHSGGEGGVESDESDHGDHGDHARRRRRRPHRSRTSRVHRRRRTEYERREAEFNMMRAIQHDAARRRRWLAMATSGTTWILLWLVGAWVFQASEAPYQQWNYFDGFYLAFVGLTTIGYGDMVPQSNSGKAFFVFWSLLALPTTTVLISDAGDTIVKAISDATLAVGRITILPGERGLKRDLKAFLQATTCGVLFDDVDIEEAPPGLLGAAQETEGERANDAGAGGENTTTTGGSSRPPTRADYHYVLIREIAAVTEHLRHTPPRKYSFQEWAWFLKLIGEDERDAELHRRAGAPAPARRRGRRRGRRKNKTEEPALEGAAPGAPEATTAPPPPAADDPRHLQWSWVGARSPLMSSQEEAEWILDKLTRRLQAELRTERDKEREAERRQGRGEESRDTKGWEKGEREAEKARSHDDDDDDRGDPDPYRDPVHRPG